MDKDGWPIGIARYIYDDCDKYHGELSIRDMQLRYSSYYLKSYNIEEDEFEVLCDGNLVWMPNKDEYGRKPPKSLAGRVLGKQGWQRQRF